MSGVFDAREGRFSQEPKAVAEADAPLSRMKNVAEDLHAQRCDPSQERERAWTRSWHEPRTLESEDAP